jgi:prophage regulatory protein
MRKHEILTLFGISHSALYDKMRNGCFPKPVKLGLRAVGWPENEIFSTLDAIISGQTLDHIRELVNKLHAQRTRR